MVKNRRCSNGDKIGTQIFSETEKNSRFDLNNVKMSSG